MIRRHLGLLCVMLTLLLGSLAVTTWAQQNGQTYETPVAKFFRSSETPAEFPYLSVNVEQRNMLVNAFRFQTSVFKGTAGASGSAVTALSYLAVFGAVIGAMLIFLFPKYQKMPTILSWLLVVTIVVFAPYGSKLVFLPVNSMESSKSCKTEGVDCGFTPQLVAIHLAATLQRIFSDLFHSQGWYGIIEDAKAKTNLQADGAFVVPEDWFWEARRFSSMCRDMDPKLLDFANKDVNTRYIYPLKLGEEWDRILKFYQAGRIAYPPPVYILYKQLPENYKAQQGIYDMGLTQLYKSYFPSDNKIVGTVAAPNIISEKDALEKIGDKLFAVSTFSQRSLLPGFFLATEEMTNKQAQIDDRACYPNAEVYCSGPTQGASNGGAIDPTTHQGIMTTIYKKESLGKGWLSWFNTTAEWGAFLTPLSAMKDVPVGMSLVEFDPNKKKDMLTLRPVQPGYNCQEVGRWLIKRALDNTQFASGIYFEKSGNNIEVKEKLAGLKAIIRGDTTISGTLITPEMIHPGATQNALNDAKNQNPDFDRARNLAMLLTDALRIEQDKAGSHILEPAEKRLILISTYLDMVANNTGTYMKQVHPDEFTADQDGKAITFFGNDFLTRVGGGTASFFGRMLVHFGAFISGPRAYAFVSFLAILVDMALIAMVVLTPVLFLAGVVMPSAAMGVLTVSVLGVFILKFIPVTLIILNQVGALVREMITVSRSQDAEVMQSLLILAMGGVYLNIVGLTFFLIFKMGNPEAILGRLQGLDASAKKIADEGMGVAKTTAMLAAAAAARPLIGGVLGAAGNMRTPEDKSAPINQAEADAMMDVANEDKNSKEAKALRDRINNSNGRGFEIGRDLDGNRMFAHIDENGNFFAQSDGGINSLDAADKFLDNATETEQDKFKAQYGLTQPGSFAKVGTNDQGQPIWAQLDKNGDLSFTNQQPVQQETKPDSDPRAEVANALKTSLAKDGFDNYVDDDLAIERVEKELDRTLSTEERQLVQDLVKNPDQRDKIVSDFQAKLGKQQAAVDQSKTTPAASGTSPASSGSAPAAPTTAAPAQASPGAAPQNTGAAAGTNTNAAAPQQGGSAANAPAQAQQAGGGTANSTASIDEPSLTHNVQGAAAALTQALRAGYIPRNNNDVIAGMLTTLKDRLKNVPQGDKASAADKKEYERVEEWINTLEKFDTTAGNAANVYGTLGAEGNILRDRLRGRLDGANARPSTWQAFKSGMYGGWNSGNFFTAIPFVGKIINEVANEYSEAPMRARAWNAMGGKGVWKRNKFYAEQAQHFNKAISPAIAGEQFAEMMSYNALQGQVNVARTAAAEAVAKTRSQYEQLLEATKKASGESKGYFTAEDLKGLGRMEAANRFSSIRAEAHLMQGETLKIPAVVEIKEGGKVVGYKMEEKAVALTNALAKRITGDIAVKKFGGGIEDALVTHYGLLEKQFERGSKAWDSTRSMSRDGAAARRFMQEDLSTDYLVGGHLKMVSGKAQFFEMKGQYESLLQMRNQTNQKLDGFIQSEMQKHGANLMKAAIEGVHKGDTGKMAAEERKLAAMPASERRYAERVLLNKWAVGELGKSNLPLDAIFEDAFAKGARNWQGRASTARFSLLASERENIEKTAKAAGAATQAMWKGLDKKATNTLNFEHKDRGIRQSIGKGTEKVFEKIHDIVGDEAGQMYEIFLESIKDSPKLQASAIQANVKRDAKAGTVEALIDIGKDASEAWFKAVADKMGVDAANRLKSGFAVKANGDLEVAYSKIGKTAADDETR